MAPQAPGAGVRAARFGSAPFSPAAALLLIAVQLAGCSASGRRATDPLRRPTPGDVQVGEISWYGIAERGRPTASGEAMDPGALTAAHRTLPFGTVVEVTVLETGRSVRVRINDRGPFARGRILDLAHEAARRLGIVRLGVARASVRVVGHQYPATGFAVQVGAFRERAGANRLAETLRAEGWERIVVRAQRRRQHLPGPHPRVPGPRGSSGERPPPAAARLRGVRRSRRLLSTGPHAPSGLPAAPGRLLSGISAVGEAADPECGERRGPVDVSGRFLSVLRGGARPE